MNHVACVFQRSWTQFPVDPWLATAAFGQAYRGFLRSLRSGLTKSSKTDIRIGARQLILGLSLLLAGTAWGVEPPKLASGEAHIHVGVLAVLDDQDTQRQWQPLLDGLSAALAGKRLHLHPLDPVAMERALQANELAFVITNPGHCVVIEARE